MCGLDAHAAFDGIPQSVLFYKCCDALPDVAWRLLYKWYLNIVVHVRWNGIGNPIRVAKGMRQGGISSPFLFNCVYKDMIDQLSSLEGGVTIGGQRFNVYCYADDVLLASTTVTGLQNLINHANNYVTNHVLTPQKRFATYMEKIHL